jgi:hypothetical protein
MDHAKFASGPELAMVMTSTTAMPSFVPMETKRPPVVGTTD